MVDKVGLGIEDKNLDSDISLDTLHEMLDALQEMWDTLREMLSFSTGFDYVWKLYVTF